MKNLGESFAPSPKLLCFFQLEWRQTNVFAIPTAKTYHCPRKHQGRLCASMRRRGHGGGEDGDGGTEAEAKTSSPKSPAKFKRTVSFGPDDTDEGRDGAGSPQSHVGRRGSIRPPPILAAAESPFPLGLNTINAPPRSLIQHVVGCKTACYSGAYVLSLSLSPTASPLPACPFLSLHSARFCYRVAVRLVCNRFSHGHPIPSWRDETSQRADAVT